MNFRYPGTKPFSAADKNIFFGRAQVLEEFYKNVCLNQLTVLFGESCVGKSSLLNAGLIPWFEENPQFVAIQVRFGVYHEQSSVTPSETLNRQLKLFAQKPTFLDDISPDELSLWHLFKNILLDYSHKEGILLV
ncbi:MAG: hypothetical protein ACKVTZ_19550, partial [Bacteroidia bacterium]